LVVGVVVVVVVVTDVISVVLSGVVLQAGVIKTKIKRKTAITGSLFFNVFMTSCYDQPYV
jgi:hypothetical protein